VQEGGASSAVGRNPVGNPWQASSAVCLTMQCTRKGKDLR